MAYNKLPGYHDLWVNSLMIGNAGFLRPEPMIVATRGLLPWTYGGGTVGVNSRGESRIAYTIGRAAAFDLQLVFGNWYDDGAGEVTGSNSITVEAGVEINGTTYMVTFNGAATVTIPAGITVISDPLPVDLAAGASFFVRTGVIVSVGQGWPTARYSNGATGDGCYESTSASSQISSTGALTLPGGGNAPNFALGGVFAPLAIVGRTATYCPSVYLLGDSIFEGVSDGGSSGSFGYASRALSLASAGALPFIRMSRQSTDAFDQVGSKGMRKRAMLKMCNVTICDLLINDVVNGRTLANIQSYLSELWLASKRRGHRIYQVLGIAGTTSSDSFATVANQSYRTGCDPGGVMDQVNSWITAQAVAGTIDGAMSVNSVLRDESTRKWLVGMTDDGIHPNTVGHAAAATALASYINAL